MPQNYLKGKEGHMEECLKKARAKALETLWKFDVGLQRLFYHNSLHAFGVEKRAVQIAVALGMEEREICLLRIAALSHDSVQEYDEKTVPGEARIRLPLKALNEGKSGIGAMLLCEVFGKEFFAPEEKACVASAILATTSVWDVTNKTARQPLLGPGSHKITRALCLADLGAAGMDPECFQEEGYRLFLENRMDIDGAFANMVKTDAIPTTAKDFFKEAFVSWMRGQVDFAKGRRALLESELAGLTIQQKEAVRGLFYGFGESIQRAQMDAEWAEKEDFLEFFQKRLPEAFPLMKK